MARVVESEEPLLVENDNRVPQHVHEAPPRSGAGLIIAIVLLIIILLALFWWRPWGGSGGSGGAGGTNIRVTTPTSR